MSTTTLEPDAPPLVPCVPPTPDDGRPLLAPAPPLVWPPALDGPEGFRAWLAGLRPEQVCGRQHKSTQCPLATYLVARLGPQSHPYVTTYHYHLGSQPYTLPRWAQLFVIAVDLPGGATHRGGAISAERALQVLERALAEERRQALEGV